mgnify:CR=1 FL=1
MSQAHILARFDNNVQQLLAKFTELLKLNSTGGAGGAGNTVGIDGTDAGIGNGPKDLEVHAVDALQMHAHAQTIVRLVEELLNLTRSLKERWVLGQVHGGGSEEDLLENSERCYDVYNRVNALLSNVTESWKLNVHAVEGEQLEKAIYVNDEKHMGC